MNKHVVGSAEFKATCLKIIDQVSKDGKSVTITKRGRPVAKVTPIESEHEDITIIGALKGSVLRFDDPFAPATDTTDWDAAR